MQSTKEIVEQYYDAYNRKDLEAFLNLLDENIIHDINQGPTEHGKEEFRRFLEHITRCYQQKVRDLVIMCSEDNKHAAAKFIVEGTYIETDKGLPDANNQPYVFPAGAFFEINNGKITRVGMSYNLREWMEQVSQ